MLCSPWHGVYELVALPFTDGIMKNCVFYRHQQTISELLRERRDREEEILNTTCKTSGKRDVDVRCTTILPSLDRVTTGVI